LRPFTPQPKPRTPPKIRIQPEETEQ
jgi:hypothetical protein